MTGVQTCALPIFLFIDEIHRLSPVVEEILYPALEDFQLDIIIGEGPAARSVKLDLPPFTLIGATTRAGMLTNPLRDRFGIVSRLEFYSPAELTRIVQRSAGLLNVDTSPEGALEIASRSRGTPRISNRLLRRVRDFAEVKAQGRVDREIADAALKMLDVDRIGFDVMDRKLLLAVVEKFGGGPVGIDNLAAAIGVLLFYLLVFLALSLASARFESGPTIPASTVVPMLFALAGGLVGFIGIVYSLLFIVVQWGSSAYSPRLHLYRDRPLVWHSFGFLVGTVLYCLIAGLALGNETQVSLSVPVIAVSAILVALALFRALLNGALGSVQLAPTLDAVASRGRPVLNALYTADYENAEVDDGAVGLPLLAEVHWNRPPAVMQQVDLPKLVRLADRLNVTVVLETPVGAQLVENGVIARVYGHAPGISEAQVLGTLMTGSERTFDQDPTFALRLLVDIALRSLSSAINDPATAVQALDSIDGLMRPICARNLEVGRVTGTDGALRVIVPLPRWEEFIELISDEIALAARTAPNVLRRLDELLAGLLTLCPEARHPPIQGRLTRIRRQRVELEG